MHSITVVPMLLLALFLGACGEEETPPPAREQVEPLLRQEAETMKREGESDVNPSLGVTVTWSIQSVELRQATENEAESWVGTIQFLIESETPELGGVNTERFERSYDYAWNVGTGSWEMR